MTLQALLVSKDDGAADVLGRALSLSEITMERFSETSVAVERLEQQRFDTIVVDFDDAEAAHEVLQAARSVGGKSTVTVALLSDAAGVRRILSAGAHFVLYKPLSEEKTNAGLRALSALLNRERRRSFRVSIQAPVQLTLAEDRKAEGIMLDLSETGMEVLTAEPQAPAAVIGFQFQLPDGSAELEGHGEVAWANPNGQSGVRFLDLPEASIAQLQAWVKASAAHSLAEENGPLTPSKLTDLSLGGCYVETLSPFPEQALVDLCLKAAEMEIHIEGMVRVTHPGFGMGVEFPSRTSEQRAQVGNFIGFLTGCPGTTPQLLVSPRALVADAAQFQSAETQPEELEDLLLELLRRGPSLSEEQFLSELRQQRSPEAVTSSPAN